MPESSYVKQMRTLGMPCALFVAVKAGTINWRPDAAGIFVGAGLVWCVGAMPLHAGQLRR